MTLRRPYHLSLVAVCAALALSGCGGSDAGSGEEADDGPAFTLYSGRDEELVRPLIDQYAEEAGVEIEVRYGDSAEMAAQLLEEGDGTPADVFYSQEVGAVGALAKADLLGSLPQEVVDRADERFRPAEGTDWVGVTGRSRVIVYNPDLVETPPTGVLDLTDPAYRGQVAWVPGNAGFQAFMTGFRVSQGEDAAAAWLEEMQANDATVYEGNSEVLEAVEAGDQPIGLINHYYWARTAPEVGGVEEMASELVFPAGDDPGGLVNATAVGVTPQGADNAEAQAFVEYLLSEEGQQYFVEETYEYPVVDGVADPEGVPALDELEGPQLDLSDLDSLQETQALLTEAGLLS
ncbi:extracellular solute-binding protein [Nocardioides aequoreus]|uniref:extracellular solute-binding protein n=1 Tax=Nocardioides aequoreus TaxID=397278 RepID=UPI0004C3029B|nr:extracellular solute-binding protein [Nocardioides aequoreus]